MNSPGPSRTTRSLKRICSVPLFSHELAPELGEARLNPIYLASYLGCDGSSNFLSASPRFTLSGICELPASRGTLA